MRSVTVSAERGKVVRLFAERRESVITTVRAFALVGQDRDVETLTELIGRSAKAGQALVVIGIPVSAGPRCSVRRRTRPAPPGSACLPPSA